MSADLAPHGQDLLLATPRLLVVPAPEADDLTWHQADERTRAIAAKLHELAGAVEAVADLVDEVVALLEQAWAMRADTALGYPDFEAYVADRFRALAQVRLPAAERVRVVLALWGDVDGERMSKRAVARVLELATQTVRADLTRTAPAARIPAGPAKPAPAGAPKPPRRTDLTLAALTRAGSAGLTITELARRCRWTYAQTSPALSRLHAQRRVVRLAEAREGYSVYVLPEVAAGRAPLERGARRTLS